MLILQRRSGESLRIGEDIEITVVSTEGGKVRLAISAPKDVTILRSELLHARQTNLDAAMEQAAPGELLHMLGDLIAPVQNQQRAPLKILKPNDKKND